MSQKIYFDESGFTGNNLLHPQQRHFAYASVATDDEEAKGFVEHLIARHRIQGGELKGSKLIRFNRGRKAIDEVISTFEKRLKVSISDKKFALACKFHEYIFEPCYSDVNSLFYGVGFHKFIANILYVELVARGAGAEELLLEFEELMRTRDEARLDNIFSSSVHPENSPIITQIREFAAHRAGDIREELDSLDGTGIGKWILDLTNTALFTLLANWGSHFDELTAVCDPSKPLRQDQEIFTSMIGRKDRVYSDAFGESHPITFNLSGPIVFADSKVTHGIQIADAVAAAAIYVFSGEKDDYTEKWRETIARIGHYGSVIPDLDAVNLREHGAQRNALLLLELHSRAKAGKSISDGMADYINVVSRRLITNPINV